MSCFLLTQKPWSYSPRFPRGITYGMCFDLKDFWQWSLPHNMILTGNVIKSCSKLHHQKPFELKHVSYKIRHSATRLLPSTTNHPGGNPGANQHGPHQPDGAKVDRCQGAPKHPSMVDGVGTLQGWGIQASGFRVLGSGFRD